MILGKIFGGLLLCIILGGIGTVIGECFYTFPDNPEQLEKETKFQRRFPSIMGGIVGTLSALAIIFCH